MGILNQMKFPDRRGGGVEFTLNIRAIRERSSGFAEERSRVHGQEETEAQAGKMKPCQLVMCLSSVTPVMPAVLFLDRRIRVKYFLRW